MLSTNTSDIFINNVKCWKVFGLWPGSKPTRAYKLYSFLFLFNSLIVYSIIIMINIIYMPFIKDLFFEFIYFFNQVAGIAKALTILMNRKRINHIFNILDGHYFEGIIKRKDSTVEKYESYYKLYFKMYAITLNLSYIFLILPNILQKTLPVSNYYFLDEYTRDKYFYIIFAYQSLIYIHAMYNVCIDTFGTGLIMMAIAHLKDLQKELFELKLNADELEKPLQIQEDIRIKKLNQCLRRYEMTLDYSSNIQMLLSGMIFIVFGTSSFSLCTTIVTLLQQKDNEVFVSACCYILALTTQLFMLGYLGTNLYYESQELVFAAYNSEWLHSSKRFKHSMMLFVERAHRPIELSALNLVPLSLGTFITIVKTAYSFFTLSMSFQH